MKKDIVVTFTKAGARIHKGVPIAEYTNRTDALVNPKRPLRVPPHLWVKRGNAIGIISQSEWDALNPIDEPKPKPQVRLRAATVAPNSVITPLPSAPHTSSHAWKWFAVAAAAVAVGALYWWLR